MDALIQHAQVLAEQKNTYRYLPIANRIAYVIDVGDESVYQSKKLQDIGSAIAKREFELIYFINADYEQLDEIAMKKNERFHREDARIFNFKNSVVDAKCIINEVEQTASELYEYWKVFRPLAVILSGSLTSIIAGLIACRRLGLTSFIELANYENQDALDLSLLSELTSHFNVIGTFSFDYSLNKGESYTWLSNPESIAQYVMENLERQKALLRPKELCFIEGSKVAVNKFGRELEKHNGLASYFNLLYKSLDRQESKPEAQYDVLIATSVEITQQGKGYALRVDALEKALVQQGREVRKLSRSEAGFKITESYKADDGIGAAETYRIDSSTAQALLYKSYLNIFNALKESSPRVIIVAGDFSIGLPILLAAKVLGIPVLKEYLHYSDLFREESSLPHFDRLNFKHKFALEETCFNYSQHCFYMMSVKDGLNTKDVTHIVDLILGDKSNHLEVLTLEHKKSFSLESTISQTDVCYVEFAVDASCGGNEKGVVVDFQFFDSNDKKLAGTFSGFSGSKAYPNYRYVDTRNRGASQRVLVFNPPQSASKVVLEIVSFASNAPLSISGANVGSISLNVITRWLSLGIKDVNWVKAVESYVHKEGAQSLRLALLYFKHSISNHPNDLRALESAVEEMVELDRNWIPDVGYSNRVLSIPSSEKMTVAHLHKTAYPYENTGGAIRCLNTVLSQKRLDMDPYIVTPIGYPRFTGIENSENHCVIEGIEHFRIGANTDGLRGLSLPQRTTYSAFYTAKIMKKRGAKLIHAASGVRGYELALQALALKRLTGLPLLYEVRSFHEHTWSQVRPDAIELERTQLRVIKEDFCMEQADFVTTISYSMRNILIERGVPESKIEVIPNSIDEFKYLGKEFKAAEISGLEGADYVVGYISNMSKREGHEYLIRAIHVLRDTTKLNIKGLLVGNGPERENLLKLTEALGLQEHIIMPGEVDHQEINSYYKAIDLFVIPRIPDYAADWVTPLKPYEAMALEVPIIVTNLPALREIVGEGEERGLIAEPASVDSLVLKLREYIDNENLRREKVAVAKEWVFQERTWTANAKRYESIYKKLIEKAQVIDRVEVKGKGELQHDA